ncbi:MAG: FAD-dependent oxidoreductase [Patescibacteria group bacterium]
MRRTKAKVIYIQKITPTVIELAIARSDGRPFFEFRAGQYATVSFPDQPSLRGERSFSIASAPSERSRLRFGVRVVGRYTTKLSQLQPGERVMVGGPFGKFTYEPERDDASVFLAGGIGITPFLSMIQLATERGLSQRLTLFYSVRSLNDASYQNDLERWQQTNPNFKYFLAVTNGQLRPPADNLISGRLNRELLTKKLADDLWNRTYFLCGPPAFMSAMTAMLRSMGFSTKVIHSERFGVGSQEFIERGTPIPKYVFAAWGVSTAILLGAIVRIEQAKHLIIPPTQDTSAEAAPIANEQGDNSNQTNSAHLPTVEQSAAQPTPAPTTKPTAPTPTPAPSPAPKPTPAPSTNTAVPSQPTTNINSPAPAPTPAPKPAPVVPRTTVS